MSVRFIPGAGSQSGIDAGDLLNAAAQDILAPLKRLPRVTAWASGVNGVTSANIYIIGDSTCTQKFNASTVLDTAGRTYENYFSAGCPLSGANLINFGSNGNTINNFSSAAAAPNPYPAAINATGFSITNGGTAAAQVTITCQAITGWPSGNAADLTQYVSGRLISFSGCTGTAASYLNGNQFIIYSGAGPSNSTTWTFTMNVPNLPSGLTLTAGNIACSACNAADFVALKGTTYAPSVIVFSSYGINDARIGNTAAQIQAYYQTAISTLNAAYPTLDILIQIPHTLSVSGNLAATINSIYNAAGAGSYFSGGATAQSASTAMRSALLSIQALYPNVGVLDIQDLWCGTTAMGTGNFTLLSTPITATQNNGACTATAIDGSGNVTLTFSNNHNFQVGDPIMVSGLSMSGGTGTPCVNTLNCGSTVGTVVSATSIKYAAGASAVGGTITGSAGSICFQPSVTSDQLHLSTTGYSQVMDLVLACILPNGNMPYVLQVAATVSYHRYGIYTHLQDNNRIMVYLPQIDYTLPYGNPDFLLIASGSVNFVGAGSYIRFNQPTATSASTSQGANALTGPTLQITPGDIMIQVGAATGHILPNGAATILISAFQIQVGNDALVVSQPNYTPVAIFRHKYALSPAAMTAIFGKSSATVYGQLLGLVGSYAGSGHVAATNLNGALDLRLNKVIYGTDLMFVPNISNDSNQPDTGGYYFSNGGGTGSQIIWNSMLNSSAGTPVFSSSLVGYQFLLLQTDANLLLYQDQQTFPAYLPPVASPATGNTFKTIVARNSVFNNLYAKVDTLSSGPITLAAAIGGNTLATVSISSAATLTTAAVSSSYTGVTAGSEVTWTVGGTSPTATNLLAYLDI